MGLRWVVAIFFAVAAVFAQDQGGEVRGRVVASRDSEPLALVQVQLSDTPLRAVTGDDGTFRIPAVPAGNYELRVSTVGYHLVRQEFALAAGEIKSFDVVLTSSTARRTDSVEVSAGPFEIATQSSASAMTIEGQERKNLASVLADDPLRAVQSLPGVTSNNDFSSEFSLRGAPFNRIGLYLDGVLLHAPFHTTDGQADNGSLTIFNGDMLDDMTLYQGAWPVRYSDRTAGILAVESREGNRKEVQVRLSASASNAGILVEGPWGKSERGSWLVAFRKSYLQYILNRIDFGDQPAMAFGFTDGQAHLTYDLTARHNLSLSYLEGSSSVDRTAWRDGLGVNAVMTSGFRFTLLSLASRYTPSQRLLVTNRLAWSRERGDVANRDHAGLADQAYGEWTWHGDASLIWGGKNTLDFGGVFRRLRQDGAVNRFVYTPALASALDVSRGTGSRAGGYAQQSLAFAAGKVRLAAGMRWDRHSVSPVDVISPYASISAEPRAKIRLQLDWGQYAQFPELSQSFSVFARSRLLPERATHYEAAVEQRLDERTRIRLEFYNRQDRDLLARPALDPRLLGDGSVLNALPNAPLANSQRGYSRGVEVFLQRRSANGFTGWISYAYGRAVLGDGRLRLRFPADYDQPHTFNSYVSHRLRSTVNLSARFTYGSGMPLPGFYRLEQGGYWLARDRNSLRAPSYQRTDLRLNKAYVHKKSKTTLFAEIVNLTNRHNRDFDSAGPYESRTGRTYPSFYSMFPILPSAGVVCEF
ncbi:MAG: TonB-dependent receptor [Acidobacteria bacterium]|nr:TonB-dependent receptor [Acidobacteriota bacterium]